MSWSNRDRDWKNANSLFKWRFRGRRRRGILNSQLYQTLQKTKITFGKLRGQQVFKNHNCNPFQSFLNFIRFRTSFCNCRVTWTFSAVIVICFTQFDVSSHHLNFRLKQRLTTIVETIPEPRSAVNLALPEVISRRRNSTFPAPGFLPLYINRPSVSLVRNQSDPLWPKLQWEALRDIST